MLELVIAVVLICLNGVFALSELAVVSSREVRLKVGDGEIVFDAQRYLLQFAIPNFFFHVTTAYDVLRHVGVPVGKRDYLGR